jgi:hypothetical protein
MARKGFRGWKQLKAEKAFDPLRNQARFKKLVPKP